MYPRNLTWVELKEYIGKGRGPLVLPVGSVEGHGLHLPINTDTIIASFIADKLAERNNWVSLPPITYTVTVPVRPGNVHIPPRVLKEYLRSILEHFISFGQKEFILIMGHGGPEMKEVLVEVCDNLCRGWGTVINAFHVSRILRDLQLVDTDSDKHAGEWETSIIMAIDSTLVKNLGFYRECGDPRRYGVVGNPLKASPAKGLKYVEAVINYVEESFARNVVHRKCYYNWLIR